MLFGDDIQREHKEAGSEVAQRPVRNVPFPTGAHLQRDGILGDGGAVVLIIGDQGLSFDESVL